MISAFGSVSLVILLVSAAALIMHFRLIKRRGAVDDKMDAVDELLRDRLEIMMDIAEASPNIQELRTIYEAHADLETRLLTKAWPKIQKAFTALQDEIDKSNALTANSDRIDTAIRAGNSAIEKYNLHISKYPGRLIALSVGFKPEKPLKHL